MLEKLQNNNLKKNNIYKKKALLQKKPIKYTLSIYFV